MWTRSLFSPKTDIDKGTYVTLSLISVAVILALWCLLTYGGITPRDFLAAPHEVVQAGIKRMANMSLFEHMWASLVVILSGFILASIFAVPIGILMGSFRAVQALIEPITGFMRYIPVSALIPLLILWIGIGIEQKIMVIFLGTFFQQLILISDVSARISKDLIDCAYTLGADRRRV
ncbi:MAG TPA: ABC transporter permease, partial [Thalassospira sp.]|nr:ABC transporter permease [Thalassospira sp.]